MKYQIGQTVILLDTEFKPAANAVVKEYNKKTEKYLVEYKLSPNSQVEQIWVSQERLSSATNIFQQSRG